MLPCSKCLQSFPDEEIVERGDEQVCPKCFNMLDFLESILAEKQQVQARKGQGRTPSVPHAPAVSNRHGKSATPSERSKRPDARPAASAPQTAPETDSAGRMWFAVMVYGGDAKAARHILDYFVRKTHSRAIGRVLVPKAYQEVTLAGKFVQQYRKAMPGYLLVKCRPDCLDELRRAPHVSTVLPYSDPITADEYERLEAEGELPPAPIPIPHAQVEPFMKRGPKPKDGNIAYGDYVQIRGGQWEGQRGDVVGLNNDGTVVVSVNILGVATAITEPKTNLQKFQQED